MEKQELDLGGFNAVFEGLSTASGEEGQKKDYPIVDPKKVKGEEEDPIEDPIEEEEEEEIVDPIEEEEEEEIEEDEEDTPPVKKKESKEEGDDEISDLGEYEEDIASMVQEKIFEQFGWELGETKFKNMEEVSDFIKEVINQNSQPQYADEEIQKMDEYVKSGGKLADYYDTVHGGTDLDSLDISTTSGQKSVVRENLKLQGYSEARINKALERYEDAGTLAEEAEDAFDLVKSYKEKMSDKLLEDQKKIQAQQREQQQKYYESVENEIKALDNVRGIDITPAERKQLLDYIFRPTSNGRTQYQNDYVKNQRNLIESAYFTMKGDKLVQKVQKKASSDATMKLRKKLASKGKRGKDQNAQGSSTYSFLDSAYGQLRKPTF